LSAIDPGAFDALAPDYDNSFTASRLGRLLRARVWSRLEEAFSPGQHLLELACGTGEDAVWLAGRGLHVTATDGSAEMIELARAKADSAGVSDRVEARQLSLQELMATGLAQKPAGPGRCRPESNVKYDGVYADFGGLNTIRNWRTLARRLAGLVKPRSLALFVPMGPLCPWEVVWHLGHGQPRTAWRRRFGTATAQIGSSTIPIWYPSPRLLAAEFSPWFRHIHTESLGLWLPPSYLDHFVDRWPGFFTKLSHLERRLAGLTGGWGDHYIIVFQHRG
jgi:SAM-dependent methyltransferase